MLLVGGAGVLLIASALARAARTTDSAAASTANDRWTPPDNYHYDDAASFRGLTTDGKVEHYDVAGHACVQTGLSYFAPLRALTSAMSTGRCCQESTTLFASCR